MVQIPSPHRDASSPWLFPSSHGPFMGLSVMAAPCCGGHALLGWDCGASPCATPRSRAGVRPARREVPRDTLSVIREEYYYYVLLGEDGGAGLARLYQSIVAE